MDISKCGEYLVTCDGEQIIEYSLQTGEQIKKLFHKESELDLVRFTHNSEAIICVTQKICKFLKNGGFSLLLCLIFIFY